VVSVGLGLAAGVLGAALGLPGLIAAGLASAAIGTGAFAREALNLGRVLHAAVQTVARRARLHHAPPIGDRAPGGE